MSILQNILELNKAFVAGKSEVEASLAAACIILLGSAKGGSELGACLLALGLRGERGLRETLWALELS